MKTRRPNGFVLIALDVGRRWLAAILVAAVLSTSVTYADTKARSSAEQQQQTMETWVYGLALQAATYGAPIVAMYNLRSTIAFGSKRKAPPNDIWRIENIATPAIARQAGYVTPNVNVIYGFGFMDLGQQPIILTAPDSHGRYYMIEVTDMWTNAFAYPAGKTQGYKGGKFALVGPGWRGTLPEGVTRIDCPTRWVELQPRVHVTNQTDLAAAEAILHAVTTEGLAQYNGGPAPAAPAYHYEVPNLNPLVASSHLQFKDPLQFWEIFSAAMNENPPPENEIKAVLPQFKYLGIELGKQWNRGNVNPLVLAQMKRAAAQVFPMMLGASPLAGKLAHGWWIPPADTGDAGTDYLSRAIVAVGGLTANTPAQAIYYTGTFDGNGQQLTGAKRYTLTFRDPMQYLTPIPPGFWSVTMYDDVTGYSSPNPINRYSLGSDNNLKRNEDGSLTLYLQHDNPGAAKESNWLPAPAGPFYLVLRNYAPVDAVANALKDLATFVGPPPVIGAP